MVTADRITVLDARLRSVRSEVDRRKGEQARLLADRAECESRLSAAKLEAERYDLTAALLQQTGSHARSVAKAQIENLVTSYLQAVFGPGYAFLIELGERAGRPEAEFYVVSPSPGGDSVLKSKPEASRGGGVVDIVATALRIAMLETYRPQIEGPLILDEPLKHVSDEYIQPAVQLLVALGQHFGRQGIMVTHDAHLAESGARHFRVELHDGESRVTVDGGTAA